MSKINKQCFFPNRPLINPKIYAYRDTHPQYEGLLKVGYTAKNVRERVAQQYPTLRPGELPYEILVEESAVRNDGSNFKDHDVHRYLRERGIDNPQGEWFRCTAEDVKAALISIKTREVNEDRRTLTFGMRPEQEEAVRRTREYFARNQGEKDNIPHFLWNAKMRFGKTFAAYQLAKEMGWMRILVLTFKPAVENSWQEDISLHVDFKGWQFISKNALNYDEVDLSMPIVCFGSFQDFLGKNSAGGIKLKNQWAHEIHWDCIILDEYHYGAWRERAHDLFESEDKKEQSVAEGAGLDYFDEKRMPLITNAYLYLSGTPFRAIASGEFIEDQIFNWTYSDEQKAKNAWKLPAFNPYASLPRMVLLTYQLPDIIREVAKKGEFNEFDLNLFFSAQGDNEHATFVYEESVQQWLNLIRGGFVETIADTLKLGSSKPPMPFLDTRLLALLSHTFWFLPNVSSCYAMRNLLQARQNIFYHEYVIVVCAGDSAGIGMKALEPVRAAMNDPLNSKSITLSCGKLTTGVSVSPWTGIFMLRNTSTPETYFQAAFRVQTPWVMKNPEGDDPNKEEIMKHECYVLDFAPDRALRQIADYSCRLNINERDQEKKVEEFINFLPVLCYDGSGMKEIDAAGVLDIALSGTTATLLARRWESALLVNVDNTTLQRLMNNEEAMKALMSIEGFRSLNKDIEIIINKTSDINKMKQQANDHEPTASEKRKLSEVEKEQQGIRKKIQDKLIKFATRLPIFMYLTDYREYSLKDIIAQLEPSLFLKVTGLVMKDFDLLVSLGVFNGPLMNDAVYKFKRYEDASLNYMDINKHEVDAQVGLYDTTVTRDQYNHGF